MLSRLDVIAPPTEQVVSLATLRQFVRVFDNSDDAILSNFIDTATDLAQNYLNRVLLTHTLQYTIARTVIPHANSYGIYNNWNQFNPFPASWYPSFYGNRTSIELPRSPVQAVQSVSLGYWGQSPDTFLNPATDYYLDLATTPARLSLVNFNSGISMPDHLSVVYTAGYTNTASISISGTPTAAGSLTATVGGQNVSVSVATTDTAQTVSAALFSAIGSTAGAPSASLIAPALITLRGDNVAVSTSSVPTGLTVSASAPVNSIPTAITNAILHGAAFMYQNLASPEMHMPGWFYHGLAPYRLITFA